LALIKAMNGDDFFAPSIVDTVKQSVQLNAMTPSVARDFVQDLMTRRGEFLTTVRNARQNLEALNVKANGLPMGRADVSFLIPREIFDNQLGPFAKELSFINRLVEHYSEAISGQVQPAELEQISSSIPTINLLADISVITAIAVAVNKFLDAWEKIERIRRARAELSEMGLKGKALEELDDRITTTVEEVVEESTKYVMTKYDRDGGRKRELETAIKKDTARLFGQIERGLTVEFRTNTKTEDAEAKKNLELIDNLAKKLAFPEPARQPLLLQDNAVVDGDDGTLLVQESKKTARRITTTAKKSRDGAGSSPE
jgi:hypothetical protein